MGKNSNENKRNTFCNSGSRIERRCSREIELLQLSRGGITQPLFRRIKVMGARKINLIANLANAIVDQATGSSDIS